jgi:chaperonin GroEL (HSP60 family)
MTNEELLDQGVHPTIIASGYRLASAKAKEILKTLAKPVTLEDKDMLLKIALQPFLF